VVNILRSFTRGDWTAIIGYLLLTALLYHKAWLHGQFFFGGDLALYHGPNLHYVAERLAHFELPLWNPYVYGGTPFPVSPQTGVFYPANWLGLLLTADRALTVLAVAHLVLAAALMYAFCRQALGLGPLSAFVGAVSFTSAGNLPAHFEHTAVLMSGAWLPGILWSCYCGLTTRRFIWFVLAGAMLGLSILAGGVQFVYVTCCAVFLLSLFHSLVPIEQTDRSPDRIPKSLWHRLQMSVLAVCLVALIAAAVGCAQLLPTVRFIPFSLRAGGMDFQAASRGSVPPLYAFIMSICPHFFGHQGNAYWGVSTQQELSIYLGLIPLSLAPLGLMSSRHRRAVIFLGLLGGASLLLALGNNTPLYRLAYSVLPGLAYLRVPARFLLLFCFAGGALGAVGLDELLRAGLRRRVVLALACLVAFWVAVGAWGAAFLRQSGNAERLAPLGINDSELGKQWTRIQLLRLSQSASGLQVYYWRIYVCTLVMAGLSVAAIAVAGRRPSWGGPLVALVLCLDLVAFNRGLSPWANAGWGTDCLQTPSWMAQLKAEMGKYRCALPELLFQPNLGMLHGLPVMDGYDPFLPQSRHTDLVTARSGTEQGVAHRLAQLFSVAYQAARKPSTDLGTRAPGADRESITVSHRDDVPPRARLVYDAEIASNGSDALARVLASDLDPWRRVIIEGPLHTPPGTAKNEHPDSDQIAANVGTGSDSQSGGQHDIDRDQQPGLDGVRWIADKAERLALEVDSLRPGWLLISDAYWPSWKAYVNGQEVPIRRANYYFRAVPVPAGRSVVVMSYSDRSVRLAAGISLVTCIGIVALVSSYFLPRIYNHRSAPQSSGN
jgi:hypothetical protein